MVLPFDSCSGRSTVGETEQHEVTYTVIITTKQGYSRASLIRGCLNTIFRPAVLYAVEISHFCTFQIHSIIFMISFTGFYASLFLNEKWWGKKEFQNKWVCCKKSYLHILCKVKNDQENVCCRIFKNLPI